MSEATDARRYHTLDAIRGLAAIIVAIGHVENWFGLVFRYWMAVDMFFLMSGFVLAKAYDGRLKTGLTVKSFMIQRYIRLYPLYIAGVTISVIAMGLSAALGHTFLSGPQFAVALLTGLLMLPSPLGAPDGSVVPLNPPGWSLFFEMAANLVFAACWRLLRGPWLIGLVLVCQIGLVIGHMHGAGFGGWQGHFWWGFPRVGFSFFLGVLLERCLPDRRIQTNYAWLILVLMLVCLTHKLPNGDFFDGLIVAIIFPVLVALAVLFEPPQRRLCGLLGLISYPLYAMHHPLEMLVERAMHVFHTSADALSPFVGIAFLAVVLPLCVAADRYYDMPVRRWLTMRFVRRRSSKIAVETAPAL